MTDLPCPCESIDILIIGAGPVGMTLHLALAAGGQSSLLIDRRAPEAALTDPRALALSHGARQLLETLSAWPQRQATPIETIHVSQRQGFGRTLMDHQDYDLPALGYVVRYRDLSQALFRNIQPDNLLSEAEIVAQENGAEGPCLTIRHKGSLRQFRPRLLIHAEGTPGDDPKVQVSDYHQHAVIAEVTPSPAHQNRAWERFTPDGPLALLPLGEQFSVVFTLPPAKADAVMALDDTTFLAALQEQFGARIRFSQTGPRSRYPLALRLREPLVDGPEIWIGNTAQTLHPVSGQGFNLGLRDAWELAEILLKLGVDRTSLQHYARQRQFDRKGSACFTDGIVRLFSNDLPPLKLIRGLGLLAMDLFPPARHLVARRMIWGARAWP